MQKIKIFGTLAETTRLFSSVLIIVFFASTLKPQIFVALTLSISSANLVATVSSLGIPIWINIKFSNLNLVRARSAIFLSSLVFLPLLVLFANLTFLNGKSSNWSFLLFSEFLLAGPIAFENRVLLSEMKDRKYLSHSIIQTSGRTLFLISIAFYGQTILFISFFFFVFFLYSQSHIRKVRLFGMPAKLILRTYSDSLSIGSIGMLANFFDNLPIICAGSFLKPVEAATTQLVLRTTSVSLIPSNALANVSLAEKSTTKDFSYIRTHLIFSIFSSLSGIISIFLTLKYLISFKKYPGLVNFLWFQIISVINRSFLITIGNYLTFRNRNNLRIGALGAACCVFLSFVFLSKFQLFSHTATSLLFGYMLSEISAVSLIIFHAKRIRN